jgi:DNA helicase HerA-like ATPase
VKSKKLPSIFIGGGESPQNLLLKYANRHGLIAGATGTGKTVTLQILAEAFSKNGVPVFLSDVKGDLSGLSQSGKSSPRILERVEKIKLENYENRAFPTVFWDLFGKKGHPIRTTISEMGPLLLSRLLGLNDIQEGILNVAFQVADDEGLLILDLKDLRSLMNFVGENAGELTLKYGNVTKASIGAILRRLLTLEQQGAKKFFGEPALKLEDFLRTDRNGQGMINILAADKLMQSPKLYSTFLLWLLSELFEELPEVGDLDQPKLVFFFDEAHLLFKDAPKALVDKIEQVVRLIRSKGVGVYFVTQSPLDIPENVLGQLGNRVQHALRAFTPKDKKTVRAVGDNFRPNPKFNAASVIKELGVGEALVSTLEAKGRPSVVERTLIRPPSSRMGPAKSSERNQVIAESTLGDQYNETVDRKSAYEILQKRAEKTAELSERKARQLRKEKELKKAARSKGRKRQSVAETGFKSMMRSIGRVVGRELVRGLLGSFMKRR